MTSQKLIRKIKTLSLFQSTMVLGIVGALFYYGMDLMGQQDLAQETLVQDSGRLQAITDVSMGNFQEGSLKKISEILKKIEEGLLKVDQNHGISQSFQNVMSDFEQLENARGRLQDIILTDSQAVSQEIDRDLLRLISTNDGQTSQLTTMNFMAIRYGYNLSRHHLAFFSEYLRGDYLTRSRHVLEEAMQTLVHVTESMEAGRKMALLLKLKQRFGDYQGMVQLAEKQQQVLEGVQKNFDHHVQNFYKKIRDMYQNTSLVTLDWMADGAMILLGILACCLVAMARLFGYAKRYGEHLTILRRSGKRAGNMTKPEILTQAAFLALIEKAISPGNDHGAEKLIQKKDAWVDSENLLLNQKQSRVEDETKDKSVQMVASGFGLSNMAKELHGLLEKTHQLHETMAILKTSPKDSGHLRQNISPFRDKSFPEKPVPFLKN